MRTYWNTNKGLKQIGQWEPNCWIQVTCPTEDDQRLLEEEFKIPDYFLSDISDNDERARYEYDDGWMLIILRIPFVKEIRSRTPYTTVPLGIIHKRDVTITVCFHETNMMIDFVSYQQKRGEGFTDYVDMIFRLFLSSAVWYLKRLKQINNLIEKAKRNLDREVNNESLIGLSRLQDSLTYFITSIRGNENLLAKLKFKPAGGRAGCRPHRGREHRDEPGARDHEHILGHPRIDDGHILKHHQQQHEHRDAYAHLGFDYPDVPHAYREHLRHEPDKRHGRQQVRLPHRNSSVSLDFRHIMVDFPPQTSHLDTKRQVFLKLIRLLQYFYISLQTYKATWKTDS